MKTYIVTYLDGSKEEFRAEAMETSDSGKVSMVVSGRLVAVFNFRAIISVVKKEDA